MLENIGNKASTWTEISSIVVFKNVETRTRVSDWQGGYAIWEKVLQGRIFHGPTGVLLHLLLEQTKRLGVEIIVQLLAIHSVFLQMTSRKGSSLARWPPYSLDSPNSFNVVLLGLKELLLSPMRCSRSTRLFAVTPSNKLIDVLSSVLSCLLESIEPL